MVCATAQRSMPHTTISHKEIWMLGTPYTKDKTNIYNVNED